MLVLRQWLKVKVKSLSHVWLCIPWTVAYQAAPSMGFSRQEYWSRLPFPSPGDLPNPGIEPRSPTLQADALTSELPGKPLCYLPLSDSVQSLSGVWLFVTPWNAAIQASLSIANSRSLLKFMLIESVMPSNHLILCRPILLLPSVFPSIRVFSNESALHIRWPKYWSFSFNISPSNEYSGLISFRMDWLDLCSPRDSQESSPTPQFISINSSAPAFFIVQLSHPYMTTGKTIALTRWAFVGKGNRDQIANICWIIEKAREFQKNNYFCFIDYAKAFDCVDHNKLESSERDGNTRPPDLPLLILGSWNSGWWWLDFRLFDLLWSHNFVLELFLPGSHFFLTRCPGIMPPPNTQYHCPHHDEGRARGKPGGPGRDLGDVGLPVGEDTSTTPWATYEAHRQFLRKDLAPLEEKDAKLVNTSP